MITTALAQLRYRLTTASPRTRRIHRHTLLSLASKGGSMLVSLWLVPLTMTYLTPTTYGTWATISAMSALLTFVDLGIGNGLRNRLAEAVGSHNPALAQQLVSTAYALFGLLQVSGCLLLLGVSYYVPWGQLLHSTLEGEQLRVGVLVVAIGMSLKLVFDLLSYVLLALQASGWVNLLNLLSNGLVLLGTYGLARFTPPNLIYLAWVVAGSPVVVLALSSVWLYGNRLRAYQPRWGQIRFDRARQILSLGYTFFIIQLAYVVIFYTDNLLINHFFGPAEVASYSIAFRYFSLASTLFGLVMVPYWSAFSEALVQEDRAWMGQTYRVMQRYWVGLAGLVAVMIGVSQPVYAVWVGNQVSIGLPLTVSLGLFVIVTGWNVPSTTVINSTGRLRLQLWYAVASIGTNIPLAYVLGKTLGLGSSGVVLASVLSLGWGAVLGPIQARKLIEGKAEGIWNR